MGVIVLIPFLIMNLWSGIILLCFALVSFFGIISYRFQQRAKGLVKNSEKETTTAEMKLKVTELEMRSLRSQMNPHFLFNSLSLINNFILQNNNHRATEYLGKFSRYFRLILQNSEHSLVNLNDELESVKLYLELETLRFEERFEYKITVPEELQTGLVKVPPLLIQPFVDNAIWHGLMHKEEKGLVDIELSTEHGRLFFRISDNGIGRKAAEELASKSATRNKLLGIEISSDRLAIMNSSRGDEMNIKINDLHDANGVAAGTEVIIKMPLIYD